MYKLLLFVAMSIFTYANNINEQVSIQDEQSFWIALFGLAVVGILSLYLASDQIKQLNKKHSKMLIVQSDIQKKQNFILETMSKKIETSTKGIMLHKERFVQTPFSNLSEDLFNEEMQRFEESEAILLDATHELMDFLQIKSGNLEIKEESYKLSNMLNETYSFVSEKFKENKIELIYKIEKTIAPQLKGDSKRTEQILNIFLSNLSNNLKNSIISLNISESKEKKNSMLISLHSKDKYMTTKEIENLLINYSLNDEYSIKENMDTYIANELIKNMFGDLTITSTEDEGIYYNIELPYLPQDIANITSTKSKNKKVLVVEMTEDIGDTISYMLEDNAKSVDIYSKENIYSSTLKFSSYDMIFINSILVTSNIKTKLEAAKLENSCQIFILENIFNIDNALKIDEGLIDGKLLKPIQYEQLVNILEKSQSCKSKNNSKTFNMLKKTEGIVIDSFSKFSHIDILIVDDNLINQKILKGVLKKSGMKITVVNNGKEAIAEVKNNADLDLIFMDTSMPIMDGYEATKEIRKIHSKRSLPIIAISSAGFQNELDEMSESGANAYLHKPFQVGELYTAFVTYTKNNNIKIKNINNKLTKYVGNNDILNIEQGISVYNSAIFYKELLADILINLNKSDVKMKEMIDKREYDKLQIFLVNTNKLVESIGAKSFTKTLKEIEQLFLCKEESRLTEYIIVYSKSWKRLQKEINEYIKC